jgi:hypothetical protein
VFLARSALLALKGRPAHKAFRGPSASRARRVLPAQPGHRELRALRQRLPALLVLPAPPERRELKERRAPLDQLVQSARPVQPVLPAP